MKRETKGQCAGGERILRWFSICLHPFDELINYSILFAKKRAPKGKHYPLIIQCPDSNWIIFELRMDYGSWALKMSISEEKSKTKKNIKNIIGFFPWCCFLTANDVSDNKWSARRHNQPPSLRRSTSKQPTAAAFLLPRTTTVSVKHLLPQRRRTEGKWTCEPMAIKESRTYLY